ncbi:MAG: hypothetical protein SPI77_02355 [Corynebacterium sp.]|nr:hypothetical protein [Corynebacterium sp.]
MHPRWMWRRCALFNLPFGGSLGRDVATSYDVFLITLNALETQGIDVHEARVVVQGFGKVGRDAVRYCAEAGMTVVAVSDIYGAIYNPPVTPHHKSYPQPPKPPPRALLATIAAHPPLPHSIPSLSCGSWMPVHRDHLPESTSNPMTHPHNDDETQATGRSATSS